jgi:2,3-bisphosphoglycerate-dependent phosphoglycerate mutase
MKRTILFLCLALTSLGCSDGSSKITTFILLRHAEKVNDGTKDPDLMPEGVTRAIRLAKIFKDTPIDAIYSTNFKRTRNTVALLATAKKREIQTYESFKGEEIERMITQHAGGTVVISGHTDNIPWTANLLIGKEEFKEYEDSEYGIMLIVSVVEKGKVARVTRINY